MNEHMTTTLDRSTRKTQWQARQKIQSARTALILDQPFFGSLALRLAVVEDPGCETAWTDGHRMGYDPAFIDTLNHNEIVALIAHEVMHCANGHPWRRDSRDHMQWNIACDYAINPVLEEAGFQLPKCRIRDKAYDGKSAEWIYGRLPKSSRGKSGSKAGSGQGKSGGKGQDGSMPGKDSQPEPGHDKPTGGGCDVRDAKPEDAAAGATEADWQQATQQAAAAAKARGNLPASLDRFAKAATEPRVDWRSVLRRFVQSAAKADYSWNRPNKRYLAGGLYLPALWSESMGPIAVAVDTSGSIDSVTLNQFAAELNAVASEARPERVHVIYCDAAVGKIETFEQGDLIELRPVGGGGTAFAPALDAAERLDEQPICMIYLTDLDGSHRSTPPEFPLLWAATHQRDVPYGEVVSLEQV